ncbi:hypothetical protein [Longimonas halophila]|uniref:hypothetical protein n=1 Tax=Longimonas halophila TaxID=1469170 RepID=UPI0011433133|nr:hypothetical protein [Longimonas halophila]
MHPLLPAHRSLWCGLGWALSAVLLVLGLNRGEATVHRIPPAPVADHAAPVVLASDTTQRWSDEAWVPIYRSANVQFSYLFYPEARGNRNGVVVRVQNDNAHPICYRFTIIFRGPDTERTARARGTVPPHALRTGDAGLFWAPFDDDERIGEIGLRRVQVETFNGCRE